MESAVTGFAMVWAKLPICLYLAGGQMGGDRPDHHDETLLARTARADVTAFEALYDRYSRPVYSVAYAILRDAHAAQDVTQDVFLGIWRGAHAYDHRRGAPRNWILSLAHHKSVDAVRRLRIRATAPLSEAPVHDSDAVEDALRNLDAAEVRNALGALSPDQRAALVLAYYGGYTQREIAARVGAPLGTVKTRMRDGLLRLRAALRRDRTEEEQAR